MTNIYLYVGSNAVEHLVQYCEEQHTNQFLLVADKNTFAVLGHSVERALKARSWDVKTVVFQDADVFPDSRFIFQVLLQADPLERTFLAVGSGTVTDITRFASHRTRRPFISLPTAPSVDGYTSPSASLLVGQTKQTVIAQPPTAVFADLPTLAAAPQAMIAAGFGDILGKAIALADWKLGHLLWDEPYSAEIARRVRTTLDDCIGAAKEIGQATPDGIEKLVFALIDSGLCMLDFGNSRPASGAEHYMSHFLELKLIREGRPPVFHGAKVAMCSTFFARLYEDLRQINRAEAARRLQSSKLPDRAVEIACIHQVYGPLADSLVIEQAPFLNLSAQSYHQLKERILVNWDEIQELAGQVPGPKQMEQWIAEVGGSTQPTALKLTDEEVHQALMHSHYFRNRFTIRKLARILGMEP